MDFKIKNYLLLFFAAVGIGLMLVGVFNILQKPLLAIGLIPTGLVFVTTQLRLEINRKEKYYREYVWMLGFKWGEKIKFNEIQYFYITKSKKSQVYGQTYKNHYVTGTHFNGYIKFSENQKILVG